MEPVISEQHRLALNTIYAPFRDRSEWPQYVYVDKMLDRLGLDASDVLPTLPLGLLVPDLARGTAFIQPHEELKLTIAGLAACDDSDRDLDLFVRALRFFVQLEQDYDPPPTGAEPLRAGSAELESGLGMQEDDVRRVYLLFQNDVGLLGGGGGNPNEWSFEVPPRIRRFRGTTTISDYLERRVVPAAYPELPIAAFGEIVERIAPIASVLEHHLAPQRQMFDLVAAITAHPLVSGIIGTVIGGAILAIFFGVG